MKRVLFVLLAALFVQLSFAHNWQGHSKDMQRVFPFEWRGSYAKKKNRDVIAFYREVSNYLDHPNGDMRSVIPHQIKNHPKFGKLTYGRHRVWFHWGFTGNFKQYPPLRLSLDRGIREGKIAAADTTEFWNLMGEIVGKRNRELMDRAAALFGNSFKREQRRALVSVLYAVHILGDYQTKDVVYLAPVGAIVADLKKAIDDLAGKHPENRRRAGVLKKKLDMEARNPSAVLDVMERDFSKFLLSLEGDGTYNYRKMFEKKGYVMKAD